MILVTKTSDQARQRGHILSTFVQLLLEPCVLSSHLFWTSNLWAYQPGHTGERSHIISHPSSFCGACLNFSREEDSANPFPRRPWSRILFTKELIVLHLLGIFFFFCEEKSQSVWRHRDSNSCPNVRRFRGYQLNHRGDRWVSFNRLVDRFNSSSLWRGL